MCQSALEQKKYDISSKNFGVLKEGVIFAPQNQTVDSSKG